MWMGSQAEGRNLRYYQSHRIEKPSIEMSMSPSTDVRNGYAPAICTSVFRNASFACRIQWRVPQSLHRPAAQGWCCGRAVNQSRQSPQISLRYVRLGIRQPQHHDKAFLLLITCHRARTIADTLSKWLPRSKPSMRRFAPTSTPTTSAQHVREKLFSFRGCRHRTPLSPALFATFTRQLEGCR